MPNVSLAFEVFAVLLQSGAHGLSQVCDSMLPPKLAVAVLYDSTFKVFSSNVETNAV
ncbi:MAG: hypothetical protein VXZ82_08180 [Planctomycetota bacterium]|nr:hypothetical protein [Planctomycetota bacterium]